ncbi:MAG: hypothetical protein LBO64_08525 [Desulfovibrio sp.]|jgi:hypothetical protein|nr:hypothetical protein [Desulfovibrio sp.]
MIVYDPISQTSAIIERSGLNQSVVLSYPPSLIHDSAAAVGQLTDSASTRSFMQDRWRSVAENMLGMGFFVSGYV